MKKHIALALLTCLFSYSGAIVEALLNEDEALLNRFGDQIKYCRDDSSIYESTRTNPGDTTHRFYPNLMGSFVSFASSDDPFQLLWETRLINDGDGHSEYRFSLGSLTYKVVILSLRVPLMQKSLGFMLR